MAFPKISRLQLVKIALFLVILTYFITSATCGTKKQERFVKASAPLIEFAPVSDEILTTPSTPEFGKKLTTKSLEQNIDDYYSSVDIEFEQFNDLEKDNVRKSDAKIQETSKGSIIFDGYEKNTGNRAGFDNNWLKNYVQDERKQQKVERKRSIESDTSIDEDEYGYYDEDSEEIDEAKQDYTRYYRDSFFDRIAQESRDKRRKRESPNITENYPKRPRDITGDTVLHIRSGVSDVIKSETDLKDSIAQRRFFLEDKPKSYIDDIVIHPSKFLREDSSFEVAAKKLVKARRGKETSQSENINATGAARTWTGYAEDYQDDLETALFEGGEGEDESEMQGNDTDETLAALESRKVIICKLPDDVTDISWYKDGEAAWVGGRSPELVEQRHLELPSVGREHAGAWECRGRDPAGRVCVSRVALVVMEPPSAPYLQVFGRRLDAGNVFVPAAEGSELMLACTAERGRPAAALRWEPAALVVGYTARHGVDVSSSVAKFTVRRAHHNTTIACIATHPSLAAPMVASTLLHVQYAPRFGISRVPGFGFPLKEGSAVALRCEVDSNPPSHPRWRKDEMDPPVAQSADGYLNFSAVRREHSGWYKCSASHSLGNFSSIGYFLNVRYEVEPTQQSPHHQTVSVSGQRVELAMGGAVQLQCPPGSEGCWSPHVSSTATPAGLLYTSRGEYRCQGRPGPDGRPGVGPHALSSGGPTVYPTNATVLVLEGGPVMLEGEYCSAPSPSRVVWLAAGRALPLGVSHGRIVTHNFTNSSSPDCYIARLSILEALPSDTGELSLLVRSARGVAEAVFQVIVRADPLQAFRVRPEHTAVAASSNRAKIQMAWKGIKIMIFCVTFLFNYCVISPHG